MTPDEFREAVGHEIDCLLGSVEAIRDRLQAGEDPLMCLRSLEATSHNAEIDAMMLARKAPR